MPPEFPSPSPVRVEQLSPSLANELMACEARVAFRRDPSFASLRRDNTFSVLGEASHELVAQAMLRRDWPAGPPERRAALATTWDQAVQQGREKLVAQWEPGRPPPAEEWPNYQVTRARSIRRALKIVEERSSTQAAGLAAEGRIEMTLHDPTSILVGRADRIDRSGSSTRVVDLKSGLHQGEPTDDQLRQLLLYAVLVHRTSGSWPAEIAIETASGDQFVRDLVPTQAEDVLRQTLDATARFNGVVESGGNYEARPSEMTCRWCPFRVVCGPYWAEVRSAWRHDSVLGPIVRSGRQGSNLYATVAVTGPSDFGADTTHVSALPDVLDPGASWLAVVGLKPVYDPARLEARWSTQVASW